MTVDSTTTQVTTAATNSAIDQSKLSNDDFLKLLLAEMKYQDPTEPMDNSKMMEQTVQMSTIDANQANVEALTSMSNSFNQASMINSISFIDKYVNIGSEGVVLEDSRATFDLYIPEDVDSGTITIKDSFDNEIRTLDITGATSGIQDFYWDGKDSDGNLADDGNYQITIEAYNSNADTISIEQGVYRVDAIDYSNGEAVLKSGAKSIAINDIKQTW
jgi:flagellar basal-body rod modification protein FlgD